jgi:hypothetical protein
MSSWKIVITPKSRTRSNRLGVRVESSANFPDVPVVTEIRDLILKAFETKSGVEAGAK